MNTKEKLLHGAATGSVFVEEVSRHWQPATDEHGFIITATFVLVALEIVYYAIEIIRTVVKWFRGEKRLVKEKVREWRSYQRERVLATYRPEMDKRHPNYHRRK